jgi:hypothetical protein
MMQFNFFTFIFFKFYQWFKRANFDDTPEYSAICMLAILVTFNAITLLVYFSSLCGSTDFEIPSLPAGIFGLIVIYISYLIFVRNGKHKEIYNSYDKPKWNGRPADWILITYIVVSLGAFISLIFI